MTKKTPVKQSKATPKKDLPKSKKANGEAPKRRPGRPKKDDKVENNFAEPKNQREPSEPNKNTSKEPKSKKQPPKKSINQTLIDVKHVSQLENLKSFSKKGRKSSKTDPESLNISQLQAKPKTVTQMLNNEKILRAFNSNHQDTLFKPANKCSKSHLLVEVL